eukprot:s880_g28.t1
MSGNEFGVSRAFFFSRAQPQTIEYCILLQINCVMQINGKTISKGVLTCRRAGYLSQRRRTSKERALLQRRMMTLHAPAEISFHAGSISRCKSHRGLGQIW